MEKFLVIIGYVDRADTAAHVQHFVIEAESKETARDAAWHSLEDFEWTQRHVAEAPGDHEADPIYDGGFDYVDVVSIEDIAKAKAIPTLALDVEPKDPPDGLYLLRSIVEGPSGQ